MSYEKLSKPVMVAAFGLLFGSICVGAAPNILAPSQGTSYTSDATFEVLLQGTGGAAVSAGVWDVGEEGFVETLNGTLHMMTGQVNLKFNDFSPRNQWNMDDPPGTPNNANVRAWYQSSPNDQTSKGININQSP